MFQWEYSRNSENCKRCMQWRFLCWKKQSKVQVDRRLKRSYGFTRTCQARAVAGVAFVVGALAPKLAGTYWNASWTGWIQKVRRAARTTRSGTFKNTREYGWQMSLFFHSKKISCMFSTRTHACVARWVTWLACVIRCLCPIWSRTSGKASWVVEVSWAAWCASST